MMFILVCVFLFCFWVFTKPKSAFHYLCCLLVLPSNTPSVRRTKRMRIKPLEYWRGERVKYKMTPSGVRFYTKLIDVIWLWQMQGSPMLLLGECFKSKSQLGVKNKYLFCHAWHCNFFFLSHFYSPIC